MQSGLEFALKVIKDIEGISVCKLTSEDVVRHPLVQKIVSAYDEYDEKIRKNKAQVQRKRKV